MSRCTAKSPVGDLIQYVSLNDTILTVLECSSQALKDKKFWKVRAAGLELLLSLVNRVKQRGQHDRRGKDSAHADLMFDASVVQHFRLASFECLHREFVFATILGFFCIMVHIA